MLGDAHRKTFHEFVKRLQSTLSDIYSYDKWGREHFMPQHEFICDDKEIIVDELGRFENLRADVKRILNIGNLPHLNSSNKTPWESYYTDELRDIVYNLYRKDFEVFGYDTNI
jgi:hypothetical protein